MRAHLCTCSIQHVLSMQSLNVPINPTTFTPHYASLISHHTMARFLLAAAGLLILAAMTDATTKTIFTTTTTLEENPTGRRTEIPCSQQLAQQEMLNHCSKYLEMMSGMSTGRGRMSDPEPTRDVQQKFCCMQLRGITEMCRCEAIQTMMNQQGWTEQQIGRMIGIAQSLPYRCNAEPEICQMQAVWF
ncbi:hypothetical protein L1887_32538 [Cichorium endivia]|nr:hypothetical protein L1887_32538 [Cichorium endivia]